MADLEAWFSSSYAEARRRFVAAAEASGFGLQAFENPNAVGPQGEALVTDVASLGPADAGRAILLSSGTHGIEGYCGSGCQVGLMRDGMFAVLPADTRVVLIHALNPYGFAHKRRVNEDNIDLNRNCLDFSATLPANAAYEHLHPLIAPADYGDRPAHWDAQVGTWIKEHGFGAFQGAVSSGQYTRPDGLFYGGAAPSWSVETFRRIIRRHSRLARQVLLMDIHTGLGSFAEVEKIGLGNKIAISRARAIWGEDVTDLAGGESASARVSGDISVPFFGEMPEDAQAAAIALEYGTVDGAAVLKALRLDNWLYIHADPAGPRAPEIKAQIESAFYPTDAGWRQAVYEMTRIAMRQALGAV